MTFPKPKFRWSAISAALTTALGIALSPAVLGLLPLKVAAVITAIGAAAQALTKPVARTEAERVTP